MVRVRLPPDYRRPTDPPVVDIRASNIGQLVEELDRRVPGLKAELSNESGEIRSSLYDFFVNGKSTHPSTARTSLKDGDEVIIVSLEATGDY